MKPVVDVGGPSPFAHPMDTDKIISTVRELDHPDQPVYLVGGAVRDRLLQRQSHDLDFVLKGHTEKLAKKVAKALDAGFFVLDPERDTSRVIFTAENGERFFLDFAALRAPNLEGDLRARDFTINAIAFELSSDGEFIDPCGGVSDLRHKILRACSPTSLEDDPARVLRAVRLAVELGLQMEPQTIEQVRRSAVHLPEVSGERQRDELMRMLEGDHTGVCIRLLERLGGLEYVLPELLPLVGLLQPVPHVLDAWEHTLAVVDRLEQLSAALTVGNHSGAPSGLTLASAVLELGQYREMITGYLSRTFPNGRSLSGILKLAALYHDTGKAVTGTRDKDGRLHFYRHEQVSAQYTADRMHSLAFSNDELEHCVLVVREHMRVHNLVKAQNLPTNRAVYRFFRDCGDAGAGVCLLSLADTWATYGHTLPQELWLAELRVCKVLFEALWIKRDEVVDPPRLVTGRDLMTSLDLKPGRLIGLLLEAIREAQAAGEIRSKEAALAFAVDWLKELKDGSDV